MDKKINRMAANFGKKKERKTKQEDGEIILQLSLVRHGRDKQKTGVLGENARSPTFNIRWT